MKNKNDDMKYLKPAEAAEFLGVKVSTLACWRSQKVGPRYYKPHKRLIRYKLADLHAFLEGFPVGTTAQMPEGSNRE